MFYKDIPNYFKLSLSLSLPLYLFISIPLFFSVSVYGVLAMFGAYELGPWNLARALAGFVVAFAGLEPWISLGIDLSLERPWLGLELRLERKPLML